jgi:hypothetical protein
VKKKKKWNLGQLGAESVTEMQTTAATRNKERSDNFILAIRTLGQNVTIDWENGGLFKLHIVVALVFFSK